MYLLFFPAKRGTTARGVGLQWPRRATDRGPRAGLGPRTRSERGVGYWAPMDLHPLSTLHRQYLAEYKLL